MVGEDPENASAHAFSNRNVEGRGSDAFTAPILQDIQEVLSISRDGTLITHAAQCHPLSLVIQRLGHI